MAQLFNKELIAEWRPDDSLGRLQKLVNRKLKSQKLTVSGFQWLFRLVLRTLQLLLYYLTGLSTKQTKTQGDEVNIARQYDISLQTAQSLCIKTQWQVATSPNGQHVAVLMDDHVLIWDRDSAQSFEVKVHSPQRNFLELRRMKWSFDGKLLAISYCDGTVDIINVDQQQLVIYLQHSDLNAQEQSKSSSDGDSLIVFIDWMDPHVNGRSLYQSRRYRYELILCSLSGKLEFYYLYSLQTEQLDGKSSVLFEKYSRQQADTGKNIAYHHSFNVSSLSNVMCGRVIKSESDQQLIVVAGTSHKDHIQVFKPIMKEPFLQPLCKVNGDEDDMQLRRSWLQSFNFTPLFRLRTNDQVSGDASCVISVDYSKCNQYLLTLSADGILRVYNTSLKCDQLDDALMQCIKLDQVQSLCKVDSCIVNARWYSKQKILLQFNSGHVVVLKLQQSGDPFEVVEQFRFTSNQMIDVVNIENYSDAQPSEMLVLEMSSIVHKVKTDSQGNIVGGLSKSASKLKLDQ
ncbi:hypothetical protein MP228_012816 [Amoeboaphelidium protococcarum]|nr:hypothetical protein MP228_012816 [Amoeboaphelidium protococcarum]